MKIAVFLQGTTIMHADAVGKSREERVEQSLRRDKSVLDYANYVPVGNAVEKLRKWQQQGAKIVYLSSHQNEEDVRKDIQVLSKYNFPDATVLYRRGKETYAGIAERVMPDVLIEDDCESIGGKSEMIYIHLRGDLKPSIKHIVVKEFEGIDHLPSNLDDLMARV